MAAMSRKHFVLLAGELASERPGKGNPGYKTWLDCVFAVARVCSIDNPRFDRNRFIRACEEE